MKKVEKGDLNVIVDIKRKDEIGQLGRSFNSMIKKIKKLIEEVYVNQIKRKEAELRALQPQINPHFLYNTLDVIYWTSRLEKAYKTGKIVSSLANLFKLGLNKGSKVTTIGKEIEHLKSYLEIQKVRYDKEPKFSIDIDKSLYELKTIKLILQPLVENSLIHDIPNLGSKGMVSIKVYEKNNDIIFEIIDNGIGMNKKRINEVFQEDIEKKKGYGIKNVHERIKLYFGDQYGLSIDSKIGKGTIVKIKIPKKIENYEGVIN